eukprot:TRINITY_DN1483_c0_g2_i1.p1 TRINITY_DN1483_c0_g2~~TRINITY_DN1483_c0_g2_i1.p1  ORF type:complete len:325 (-),score=36.26 TRINITY_DN1483_c0_g2_i1:62-1036(-)
MSDDCNCDCDCDCDCDCCDCDCCCNCCDGDCCNCGGCHSTRGCDRCCDSCISCLCCNFCCCEDGPSNHNTSNHSMSTTTQSFNSGAPGAVAMESIVFSLEYYPATEYYNKSTRQYGDPKKVYSLKNYGLAGTPIINWDFKKLPEKTEMTGPIEFCDDHAIFGPNGRINGLFRLPTENNPRTVIMDVCLDDAFFTDGYSISTIFCYGTHSNNNWFSIAIEKRTEAKLVFCNKDFIVNSEIVLTPNEFQKFAITYDGSVIRWYSANNGVVTLKCAVDLLLNTKSNGSLSVGSFPDSNKFQGKMKELLVFNEALNPENVQQLTWFSP